MGVLTFIERQTICQLFEISDGYIFNSFRDSINYNKNTTQQMILEACGIDIYKDKSYKILSQQKCVEKIFDECSPQIIAKLLSVMSDYFCLAMGKDNWSNDNSFNYQRVKEIIERLQSLSTVTLPVQENTNSILILSDIEKDMQDDKPELAIDRLHTFATNYIRKICKNHNIDISDSRGNYYPLASLVGNLKKWYENENYFESDFCVVAIRNSIDTFAKYNDLRNNKSAAHPNSLLQKAEAEYAVKIVADTLMFIDNIEKSKLDKFNSNENDEWVIDDDDLPF